MGVVGRFLICWFCSGEMVSFERCEFGLFFRRVVVGGVGGIEWFFFFGVVFGGKFFYFCGFDEDWCLLWMRGFD